MRSMARSILVTEVFIRATKAQSGTGDDSAALTLMSTDIERINVGFRALHDIWASTILVVLASWMLYNHLGPIFAAPIGIVIVCLLGLSILMKFTGDSQRSWMAGMRFHLVSPFKLLFLVVKRCYSLLLSLNSTANNIC